MTNEKIKELVEKVEKERVEEVKKSIESKIRDSIKESIPYFIIGEREYDFAIKHNIIQFEHGFAKHHNFEHFSQVVIYFHNLEVGEKETDKQLASWTSRYEEILALRKFKEKWEKSSFLKQIFNPLDAKKYNTLFNTPGFRTSTKLPDPESKPVWKVVKIEEKTKKE